MVTRDTAATRKKKPKFVVAVMQRDEGSFRHCTKNYQNASLSSRNSERERPLSRRPTEDRLTETNKAESASYFLVAN